MVMELEEILGRVRRYSRFSGRPIKEESLRRIFKMARRAPAPGGSLPLRFIVVRDEVLKKKLAEACGKRMFFAEAPIIVVAAALPDEAEPFMGGYTNSFLLDSSSALTLLTLAAQEEGLGTHWTLHFKDEKIRELLTIPKDARVVGVTPIGYPEDEGERYSSSPENMVFYGEWEG
ncbi:MAG: nitroreductase family protein [Thermoplasmata archaeon]|mgnify:CR=1 FL=1|nr:nitroreductase family protein [Thermoplasmata archaeon]HDD60518.1 nitroreductase [Euryarchaeota archaeon]RLF54660.1 MAG: nitroreductase [Thermoplasmata archaeon]RLF71522.1 MAG: nitroreductase [Thermoplasmata archaeon]RLF71694.1 MAG: nitroreductase [Thermoplasmata archaeon]